MGLRKTGNRSLRLREKRGVARVTLVLLACVGLLPEGSHAVPDLDHSIAQGWLPRLPAAPAQLYLYGSVTGVAVTDVASYNTLASAGIASGSSVEFKVGASDGADCTDPTFPMNSYAYTSMVIDFDSSTMTIENFSLNDEVEVVDDGTTLVGSVLYDLCDSIGVAPNCDWLTVKGNDATVYDSSGAADVYFTLDDGTGSSGGQLGVNIYMVFDADGIEESCIPAFSGEQYLPYLGVESLAVIDLIDVPNSTFTYFPKVQLEISFDTAYAYYPPVTGVPSLGGVGGAVLVVSVLALGVLIFVVPGPRRWN